MANQIVVAVKCPECGGPVNYPEGAYTFTCPFCGSVLRIKEEGVTLRYVIPCCVENKEAVSIIMKKVMRERIIPLLNLHVEQMRIIYKPFWYFKGMLYYSYLAKTENTMLAKMWYYSFQANTDFLKTFISLSVRTEVLTLEPFNGEGMKEKGLILPAKIEQEDAYRIALNTAQMGLEFEVGHTLYNRLYFIGERSFIIYYPVIQATCSGTSGMRQDFMIDGVSRSLIMNEECGAGVDQGNKVVDQKDPAIAQGNRAVDQGDSVIEQVHPATHQGDSPSATPFTIRLLAHRCNNCGYDLKAKDFDILFYCENCYRLWLLQGGEYQSIEAKALATEDEEHSLFIPFWRFEVVIMSDKAGIELKTIGELSRFMKMGDFLLRNEDPQRPIRLYSPAMVVRNAMALLKLATRINVFQRELPISRRGHFPFPRLFNASLSEEEAEELLSVLVFAMIGRQDQRGVDFYSDFKVVVTSHELVWYPFRDQGDFLVDEFHNYNFPRKSIEVNVF